MAGLIPGRHQRGSSGDKHSLVVDTKADASRKRPPLVLRDRTTLSPIFGWAGSGFEETVGRDGAAA
jgi:hypothetical protein